MMYEKTIRVDLHVEDLQKLLYQDVIPQRFVSDEFEILVLKSSNQLREQSEKCSMRLVALNKHDLENILYREREIEQIIVGYQFIIRRCPGESTKSYSKRDIGLGTGSICYDESLKVEVKSDIIIIANEYNY